jgi:hypothetical protein
MPHEDNAGAENPIPYRQQGAGCGVVQLWLLFSRHSDMSCRRDFAEFWNVLQLAVAR